MKKGVLAIVLMLGTVVLGAVAMVKFPHYVPLVWRVPYFGIETLESKPKAISALNAIRKDCKAHYLILSSYRDPKKNKAAGGVKNSMHMKGIAFDVIVPRSNREAFYLCAKKAGFTAFGWGNRTVHIDMGKRRWWTYGDDSKHRSGKARYEFLHKVPKNFKKDFGLPLK